MSRTTRDLITELQNEAPKFDTLQLVVAFDDHSVFINLHDPDPLMALNRVIADGGEPIGLISSKIARGSVKILSRTLEEYRGERRAEDFLRRVARAKAACLKAIYSPGKWIVN